MFWNNHLSLDDAIKDGPKDPLYGAGKELMDKILFQGKNPMDNVQEAIDPLKRVYHAITDKDIHKIKSKLKMGDHIAVMRSVYSHHGIWDGRGVYEYADFEVKYSSLEKFAEGGKIYVVEDEITHTPREVIARAKSRCGEQKYNLLFNNCEQFTAWCRAGD